jgi:hypothetical protein
MKGFMTTYTCRNMMSRLCRWTVQDGMCASSSSTAIECRTYFRKRKGKQNRLDTGEISMVRIEVATLGPRQSRGLPRTLTGQHLCTIRNGEETDERFYNSELTYLLQSSLYNTILGATLTVYSTRPTAPVSSTTAELLIVLSEDST